MKNSIVATRYAKSLLNLAIEKGELDQCFKDMQTIAAVCEENKNLAIMLKSPVIRPDKKLAVLQGIFGKTLGNGYAISAVIGKSAVMDAAQNTFISSTFWTERIGPTAALKALEVMERENSWLTITEIGSKIKNIWSSLASNHQLEISHNGIPALAGFSFISPYALEYKTLITQEMLKKGLLASTVCYSSTAHSDKLLNLYSESLDEVFETISQCERGSQDINNLLEGPVCHSTFSRLN